MPSDSIAMPGPSHHMNAEGRWVDANELPTGPPRVEDLVKDLCRERGLEGIVRVVTLAAEALVRRCNDAVTDAEERAQEHDDSADEAHKLRKTSEEERADAETDARELIEWALDAGADPRIVVAKIRNHRLRERLQRAFIEVRH